MLYANLLDIRSKMAYNFINSCIYWRHNAMFQTRLNTSVWAVILITAILIPTASGEEAVTTPNTLKVGMVAPDFTLKDEEGVERSLSDYFGKKNIVLAFYPKDFTGG
ncbi:redoxin domain-containing protein [Candidatus Poribacteria bacterium]|nr:redoxin domain-containing protein [Candidatus Poribacteria bacterium]